MFSLNNLYLILSLLFLCISIFVFVFSLLCKTKTIPKENNVKNSSKLKLFLYVAVFLLLSVLLNIVFALIIFLVCGYFVYMYKQNKKTKYENNINKQLLETIRIFKNSILAGQSITQSIDTVSKQVKEPISLQFKDIYNKVNLGISLDKALEESSKQIKS